MSQGSVNSTNSKNTSRQFFVPIDDKNVVEDLQLKLLHRDTKVAELEIIQKFNEDKFKELEKEKKSLVDEVETLKTEMWQQKLSWSIRIATVLGT
ncbi:Chaperone protein DnaJ [Bienertia sinuspersici]